ncbi:unnamed protein product [Protopolystoma xenopodis]|uniref:PFU domain-containing protein n=1 Tax=Protopolystoma xenopodis TaxID=117903 RepID=A0A3S5FFT6_9PLAT|nr:unnamed protein product [Protopolystoma xenopodis]
MCYQWSSAEQRWIKIGDVVGTSQQSDGLSSSRQLFEGKEYDFVFTVDFDPNNPPVKLPYNRTDDPWMVAQTFIHKYDLPQTYLDQVAKYIITNAGPLNPRSFTSDYIDPYTGTSRYIPGSATSPSGASGEGNLPTNESPSQLELVSPYNACFPAEVAVLIKAVTTN